MVYSVLRSIGSELVAPVSKSLTSSAPAMLLGISSAVLFQAYVSNQLAKQASAIVATGALASTALFFATRDRAQALGHAAVYLATTAIVHAILFASSKLCKAAEETESRVNPLGVLLKELEEPAAPLLKKLQTMDNSYLASLLEINLDTAEGYAGENATDQRENLLTVLISLLVFKTMQAF